MVSPSIQGGHISVITQIEGLPLYSCEMAVAEQLEGCMDAGTLTASPRTRHPIISQPLTRLVVLSTTVENDGVGAGNSWAANMVVLCMLVCCLCCL
jgi:hypothetical protein